MFKRLLLLFAVVSLASIVASWLAMQPGAVKIEWFGWRIELQTSLAVAIVTLFALVFMFFDRLFRVVRGMPRWLGGRLRERRDEAGHHALTLGLMAVSAGEPAEARKYASRASRLLKAPQLTGLLAAQAAHLAGDHQAASRYFKSLLDDRETAFLGHIGLMRLAIDEKDFSQARDAARAALMIKPTSSLAASHLLSLEIHHADWKAALPALDVISKSQKKLKIKDSEMSQKAALLSQRCTLHYLLASDLRAKDRPAAIKALVLSLKADEGFLPALNMLADLYIDDKAYVKAARILEVGFRQNPHETIITRLKRAWKSNDGQFIGRLVKLLSKVDKDQRWVACNLIAEQARAVGMDGEARRILDEAESACKSSDFRDREKLFIWQCVSCKSLHEDWQAFCPSCEEFSALSWQHPSGVTPMIHRP